MDIQELSDHNQKSLLDLFGLVQSASLRSVITKRTGSYQALYSYLGRDSKVLLGIEKRGVSAAMSFVTLVDKRVFFITDLFKNPSDHTFVTFKLAEYFLKLKDIEKKAFCLVFVEEHLKAFDGLRDYVLKKYQFQEREDLIYSYIFSLPDSGQDHEGEVLETIEGIECVFFTDKKLRHFVVDGKIHNRAYVKMNGRPSNEESCKKIIEAGKRNAALLGCNTFVFLSNDRMKLGEDFLYSNRKFELWNGPAGEEVDLCQQGILI